MTGVFSSSSSGMALFSVAVGADGPSCAPCAPPFQRASDALLGPPRHACRYVDATRDRSSPERTLRLLRFLGSKTRDTDLRRVDRVRESRGKERTARHRPRNRAGGRPSRQTRETEKKKEVCHHFSCFPPSFSLSLFFLPFKAVWCSRPASRGGRRRQPPNRVRQRAPEAMIAPAPACGGRGVVRTPHSRPDLPSASCTPDDRGSMPARPMS